MRTLYSGILVILAAIVAGCGNDITPHGPYSTTDTLAMTCPPDTVIPINFPVDPDSTGLWPDVECSCMDDPELSYSDSTPVPGGIVRYWTVADTCGNADTCVQHIGLGAPGFRIYCPPDTIVPINCPTHPDFLGYPLVEGACMAQPSISYADWPLPGGITRTWIVSDTCDNADTCLQSIGQGAPGPCN